MALSRVAPVLLTLAVLCGAWVDGLGWDTALFALAAAVAGSVVLTLRPERIVVPGPSPAHTEGRLDETVLADAIADPGHRARRRPGGPREPRVAGPLRRAHRARGRARLLPPPRLPGADRQRGGARHAAVARPDRTGAARDVVGSADRAAARRPADRPPGRPHGRARRRPHPHRLRGQRQPRAAHALVGYTWLRRGAEGRGGGGRLLARPLPGHGAARGGADAAADRGPALPIAHRGRAPGAARRRRGAGAARPAGGGRADLARAAARPHGAGGGRRGGWRR